MDAAECMLGRWSVRRYEQRQVPTDLLRRVLEIAVRAPSGGNGQPWFFYAVRRPETVGSLRAAARDVARAHPEEPTASAIGFFDAPCIVVVCVDLGRRRYHWRDPAIVRSLDDLVDNPDFLSVAAATENLLLGAHALGLGACWCKPSTLFRPALERILDVPGTRRILAAVAMGYPAEPARVTPRRPVDEVCSFVD